MGSLEEVVRALARIHSSSTISSRLLDKVLNLPSLTFLSLFLSPSRRRVQIGVGGKQKFLGNFDDETDAAFIYDGHAIANSISVPRNFPEMDAAEIARRVVAVKASKKKKLFATKSSRFRGVCWQKKDKKWMVRIRVNGKQKTIGYFSSEIAAARKYDAFALDNGIDTVRNFPNRIVAATRSARVPPGEV